MQESEEKVFCGVTKARRVALSNQIPVTTAGASPLSPQKSARHSRGTPTRDTAARSIPRTLSQTEDYSNNVRPNREE